MSISRRSLLALAGSAALPLNATAARARDLIVSPDGLARIGSQTFRCAIGRGGIRFGKQEGDGATPAGQWPLRRLFYRPDRYARPRCVLPATAMKPEDGWCDAPADASYNTQVTLPYPASAEHLWRSDRVYDLVVVVGYNDQPVVAGRGSAIFLHIARESYTPTAGCVAFAPNDLLAILRMIDRRSRLVAQA